MLRTNQPTYEVGFVESEGLEGVRWVSAVVSGFNEDTSRYQQVEEILGKLGSPLVEGDFTMRRMGRAEVKALRKQGRHAGGTPLSHTANKNGLTVSIAYPQQEADLARISNNRVETVATWAYIIAVIRSGKLKRFGVPGFNLMVTKENVDDKEAELLRDLQPIFGSEQPAVEDGPVEELAASA